MKIEQHVKAICGVAISPQFVSRITEERQQQIAEWWRPSHQFMGPHLDQVPFEYL